MPPRKTRRRVTSQATPRAERGATGCAEAEEEGNVAPSVTDPALYEEGLTLVKQPESVKDPAQLASPALMHVMGQPMGGPEPDPLLDKRPDRIVVHSDALWYELARFLQIYPSLRVKGVTTSLQVTWRRLLGVRVIRAKSHLGTTDEQLMRAVHVSVTADGGELHRLLRVAAVVHGPRCAEGAATADEEACARGKELMDNQRRGHNFAKRARQPKWERSLRDALEGTMWVSDMLMRLGSAAHSIPKVAWMARPGDVDRAEVVRAVQAGLGRGEATEAARTDGAQSAAFWEGGSVGAP